MSEHVDCNADQRLHCKSCGAEWPLVAVGPPESREIACEDCRMMLAKALFWKMLGIDGHLERLAGGVPWSRDDPFWRLSREGSEGRGEETYGRRGV